MRISCTLTGVDLGPWEQRWLNLVLLAILMSQIAFIIVGQWFRASNWQFYIPF